MTEHSGSLGAIVGMTGLGFDINMLRSQSRAIEHLYRETGYKSLHTFAQACRELADEIERDMRNNDRDG